MGIGQDICDEMSKASVSSELCPIDGQIKGSERTEGLDWSNRSDGSDG